MRYTALLPGYAALILAGCTNHLSTQIGSTPALVTDADVRVITDRPSPFEPNNPARRAVCTEPPPDVAKALATALALSANVTTPSGPGGGGSFNSQTAEGVLELAGRVPGVIALRDGMYQLCQAWANGAIGDSAYALALGRYDQLLVTLMLGEDMVASSRPPPGQLVVQVAATPSGGQNGTTPANGTGNTAAQKVTQHSPPSSQTQLARDDTGHVTKPILLASLEPMFATATGAAKVPAAPAAPAPAVAATPAAPKQPVSASGSPSQTQSPGGTSTSTPDTAAVAQGLVALHRNYMTLGAIGPLMVACIEAGDTTAPGRLTVSDSSTNGLLTMSFCQTFLNKYISSLPKGTGSPGSQNAAGN